MTQECMTLNVDANESTRNSQRIFFTFIRKVYNLQAVHLEAEGRFNIGDTKDNLDF